MSPCRKNGRFSAARCKSRGLLGCDRKPLDRSASPPWDPGDRGQGPDATCWL